MELKYYNWSGITIRQDTILIGFDLFGDAVTWDALPEAETTILCLTHGHPEHAGSLRDLLSLPEARTRLETTYLISSPAVVKYINREGILPSDHAHGVHEGDSVTINGVQIATFLWRHMPLLPDGVRPKLEYLSQLTRHPVDLFQIGISGLGLPANAPTLGFHITFPDGSTIMNYAEGLHRLTNPLEVEMMARTLPSEYLLFAVEPEDTEDIPRWIETLNPETVYLYEAHRPWRDLFHLPYINLDDYANDLATRFRDMEFGALTETGQVVRTDS